MNAFDRLGRTLQAQMNNAVNEGRSVLLNTVRLHQILGLRLQDLIPLFQKGSI